VSAKTIWYRCLADGDESFCEFETTEDDFDIFMAQEAAQDYWDNHDGWEASWPLEFSLHETEGGAEVARFAVQMEAEPVFYAVVAKPKEVQP
jgi:hypothetical protein